MKKTISLILIAALMFTCLQACKKDTPEDDIMQSQTENGDNAQDKNSNGGGKPAAGQNDGKTAETESEGDGDKKNEGKQDKPAPVTSGSGSVTNSTKPPIPSSTEKDDAHDIEPDEIESFPSDGKNDEKHMEENTGLEYVSSVETSVEDFVINPSNYDEGKLTFPVVKIETEGKKAVSSKTSYVNGSISIMNTSAENALRRTPVSIRGRGNSTWAYFDKKPYKLKFQTKVDLFGMGAAKKWVLLANALDESMLRNYLAFSLADELGLEYTSDYQFVNLYINGEFQGLYLLCEQVQESSSRVNIKSAIDGKIDTGYLLEGINTPDSDGYKSFTVPPVNGMQLGSDGKFIFIIKSPDETVCTDAQKNYIQSYVTSANAAIFKKNWSEIQKYIDVDSFVNMFILNQVMLNQDMGYSFYMYKKQGGKLYLGPMWDFDQSAGSSSHGGSTYIGWYAGSEHRWLTTLIEIPEFKAAVAARYNEKKEYIHSLLQLIDNTVNSHKYDFAMSNYKFNTFGKTDRWRTTFSIASCKTYREHIVYLKTWLTNRMMWMEYELSK